MAQAARLRGEAERAKRDRAGMEEVYLSLKQGVETETEALKAKFDDLQARALEADAKRDQVCRQASSDEAHKLGVVEGWQWW